jgi:hypothetical protein
MTRVLALAMLLGCNNDSTPPDAAAYPPPSESCTDAGVDGGNVCSPPTGGCADQHWLYYYDNGQCQQGECHWSTSFFYCNEECTWSFNQRPACVNSGETAPAYYGP